LSVIECIYLLAQILTTVGYGDITPAKPRGQVFIGLYILFSLIVISNVMTEVVAHVAKSGQDYIKELERTMNGDIESRSVANEASLEDKVLPTRPRSLNWAPLLRSFLAYLGHVLAGCLFFYAYPGEGKTIFQGIYMSIVTLSTVGFGAYTPSTQGGKVFGAFWMVFGSVSLIKFVESFTKFLTEVRAQEKFDYASASRERDQFISDVKAKRDKFTALKQYIIKKGLAPASEIEDLEKLCDQAVQQSSGRRSSWSGRANS
jgi:voltage-gated potassium channel Kch